MQVQGSVVGALCLILTTLLALGGCAGAAADRPVIVATSTIVGDLTSEVAGNEATVEVLVPIGADPGTYEPTPQQVRRLLEADLIVASGLGLEAGLAYALDVAECSGTAVLRLGEELDPHPVTDDTTEAFDPYWWMDPMRAAGAIELIADRMDWVCPGRWTMRAIEAEQSCFDLDRQIRCLLYRYVPEQGRVVPDQAGLGYFAERYGFGVTPAEREPVGTVDLMSVTHVPSEPRALPSGGVSWVTEPEPAIGGASVMDTPALPRALAAPSVTLFVDSLGAPGTGAETYQEMMLTNAERVVEAGPVSFVERAHGGA